MELEVLNKLLETCRDCDQSNNCNMRCPLFEARFAYLNEDVQTIEGFEMEIPMAGPRL